MFIQSVLADTSVTDIVFDIDNCLVVPKNEFTQNDDTTNLTFVAMQLHVIVKRYYAINLPAMKLIFHAALAKGKLITFITTGTYEAEHVNPAFEKLYELPVGALQHCKCINRYSFGSRKYDPYGLEPTKDRGETIVAAQAAGWLRPDARIVVIGDYPLNLELIRKFGFKAIACCGYPYWLADRAPIIRSNLYLREINEICGLDVVLPADLYLTVGDEKLIESAVSILGQELIAKWSRVFDLGYFLRFVQEHELELSNLTKANSSGITPIYLAHSLQDIKIIRALLLIIDGKEEYSQRKACLSLQYSNRIISAALDRFKHNGVKDLREGDRLQLAAALTKLFNQYWYKFDSRPMTDMDRFFESIIEYICGKLQAASVWSVLLRFTTAGLYFSDIAKMQLEIAVMFREHIPTAANCAHPLQCS